MRRFVAALLFLMIVDDGAALYAGYIFAPFAWVHSVLWLTIAKVRLFDLIMVGVLIASSGKPAARGPRVVPMRNAVLLGAATIVLWFGYGLARGGSVWAASWQVYLMLSAALVAFTIASNFQTPEHFQLLGRVLVFAGLYRAAMCWFFYFTEVRTLHVTPFPEYLTSHDDSVLWVVTLLILLVASLQARSTKKYVQYGLLALFIMLAIQWNTRRLAWVSLALGLLTFLALMRAGPLRRKVRRFLLIAVPVVGLYVVVGTGRSEKIFRPLAAFATVTTEEDASTKARNVENLGLIATSQDSGWLAGTGWGHKYVALSNKYSIAQYFDLWPYIPHNSILGLLAYTGILGFAGFWLAFPTAVLLNARVARFGSTPAFRSAGMIGATQMIVCAAQLYGDMGLFSTRTLYFLAGSYALAMRLPAVAGVWGPAPQGAAVAAPASEAPRVVVVESPAWPS